MTLLGIISSFTDKGIPDSLRGVLNEVVQVINFIEESSLNNRLFERLCLVEMRADHSHLLYLIEVFWFFRGRISTRAYELRTPIRISLLKKKYNMA